MNQLETTNLGVSKIARYKWVAKDKPGRQQLIPKELLQIDHAYQRELKIDRVLAFARDWSWIACGAIRVARRNDGSYFVMDGQHRVGAALRRSDIKELPCIVFEMDDEHMEAAGFLAQAQRKPIENIARFKALLIVGDKSALLVDRLLRDAGRAPAAVSSKNTVRCIARMLFHAEAHPDVLVRLWPLIVRLCDGKPLHERILDGLIYIEEHAQDGASLVDRHWEDRIIKVGFDSLLSGANRAASAFARGGIKVWAMGILDRINSRCRNTFKIEGQ